MKDLFVSQLTSENGLTPGGVMNFFQDDEGFLWICTIAGLNRYDGHGITTYQSDPLDLHSLSTSAIHDITQDASGNLWIATRGGGLNCLAPRTETFTHFRHNPAEEFSIGSDDLAYMDIDEQGRLWIGSETVLTHFDPATEKAEVFQPTPGKPGALQGSCRGELIADSLRIYLGTSAGFEYYDRRNGRFRFFPFIDPAGGDTVRYQIYGMARDRYGKVWMGGPYGGLRVYDPLTDTVTTFQLTTEEGRRNSPPMRMLEDRQGFLWIAGFSDIWRITPDRSHMEQLTARATGSHAVLSNAIWSIFEDRSGLIWFGTPARMAFYFDTRRELFHFHHPTGKTEQNLAPLIVNCLFPDEQGSVWCSAGKNLYRYHSGAEEQLVFSAPNTINQFIPDQQGRFWLTTDSGLFQLNPGSGQFSPFLFKKNGAGQVAYTSFLAFDRAGDLWVSTHERGLYRLSENTDGAIWSITHFWPWEPDNPQGIQADNLQQITVDRHNNIWVCGNKRGITRIDPRTGLLTTFGYQQGKAGAISSDYTYHTIEGPDGHIWIATNGGGLNKFSPASETFTPYTIKDGLPSNLVFDLVFDGAGFLWLNTPMGISCFDPRTETFTNFDEQDGLQCWSEDLYYQASSNTIFVAGQNGFTTFSPTELLEIPKQSSPLAIVDIARFDPERSRMTRLQTAGWSDRRISLSHRENTLRLHFAVLDFRNPSRHRYRYSLTNGPSPSWVDLNEQHQVDLVSLAPGRYTFHLQGRNSDGIWSQLPDPLLIIIHPPWWKTQWAFISYILLIAGIVLFFYRFDLNRRLARQEARQLKELDTLKTNFYTNITHEFRTPLTIIMGMAENIEGHLPERQMIRRNSRTLLRLVNQLLDFSKLDAGSMHVNMIRADIMIYLSYLTESFHSAATEKDIQLQFEANPATLVMDFDEQKIQHILYNLLSNAIKFTPSNGKVSVLATERLHHNKPYLQIKVKDTGIGITERELPHIFDRFYQVDGTITRRGEGTGIGLALTKELVELLQGWIAVDSVVGKGSEFVIHLPIRKTAPHKTVIPEIASEPERGPEQRDFPPPFSPHLHDRPQLLLIEDNADVTQYIQSCVRNQFQILTATNGRDGINKAFTEIPDIIISDVMMPEVNGFEVCRTLKNDERSSHIPIILLTAKATQEDKLGGLQTGADAYLTKPFDKEELLVRLKKLMELRQALHLYYAQIDRPINKGELPPSTLDDLFLQKIRRVIEEKIGDQDLGIDDLCRATYLSHTQVFRKLKALTGEHPTGLIRKVRLHKARELLLNTDLSISEIAFDLGFSDPNYFSRVFRKEFGTPPSSVRK